MKWDLKSIITLMLMATMCFLVIILAFRGNIDNAFVTVFTAVISSVSTYYFTRKSNRGD